MIHGVIEAIGLSESAVQRIRDVFRGCPRVERVLLYGSRAEGTFKPGSDIDLSLVGEELGFPDLARLDGELDDLLLPQKFDLNLFHSLEPGAFRERVIQRSVVFYERQS